MSAAMAVETLAERVARLREAAGLTQAALAAKSGLTLSNLRQIEQGATANPRIDTMRQLAKALGVTLDELAGE